VEPSLARNVFTRSPTAIAPSEEALDPETLDRLRASLGPQSLNAAPTLATATFPETPPQRQVTPTATRYPPEIAALYPQWTTSEEYATGAPDTRLAPREHVAQVADVVGQAQPFEAAAVGAPGLLRALVSTAEPARGTLADLPNQMGIARVPTKSVEGAKVTRAIERPDTRRMRKLYEEGVKLGGNIWYHGFGDTIKRIHGDEARTYAGVVAALSPLREAGALTEKAAKRLGSGAASKLSEIHAGDIHMGSNLLYADKVWDAYKRGGIPEVERTLGALLTDQGVPTALAKALEARGESHLGIGVMESARNNVLRALHGQELSGEKIKNFREALLGNPDAVVLDTWMKKIFYPLQKDPYVPTKGYDVRELEGLPMKDVAAPPWKPGTSPVLGPKQTKGYAETGKLKTAEYGDFNPTQYAEVSDLIGKFAASRGVSKADVQAALWVAQKYLEQGEAALTGSMPFVDSLKIVKHHLGKDLSAFDPRVATALAMAGVVLASGVIGGPGGGEAEAAEPAGALTGGRQRMEP